MWSRTMTSAGEPSSPSTRSWMRRHSVRLRAATPGGSRACTRASVFSTASIGQGPIAATSSSDTRSRPSSSRFWMIASPISRVASSASVMRSCHSRWS